MCNTLIAGVCIVCNETSDIMTGVHVPSDGVVCVMCRGASRVCVVSAAMMSGVCVPSAGVTGVCVAVHYLVLHETLEEILETPERHLQHHTCSSSYSKNPAYLSGFSQKHWN